MRNKRGGGDHLSAGTADPEADPLHSQLPRTLTTSISVCEEGTGPGQLCRPFGVAYDETSHLIYVVDSGVRLFGRVCVFSEEGEYIHSFGEGELGIPIGVAISGDNIYVSEFLKCTIFHYKLPDYCLVSSVGKKGSGENEFSYPLDISTSSNGDVYVADRDNNRVVVMDCELRFKHSIKHSTMTTSRREDTK